MNRKSLPNLFFVRVIKMQNSWTNQPTTAVVKEMFVKMYFARVLYSLTFNKLENFKK